MITYFDGEIIGAKHPFLTRKWVSCFSISTPVLMWIYPGKHPIMCPWDTHICITAIQTAGDFKTQHSKFQAWSLVIQIDIWFEKLRQNQNRGNWKYLILSEETGLAFDNTFIWFILWGFMILWSCRMPTRKLIENTGYSILYSYIFYICIPFW